MNKERTWKRAAALALAFLLLCAGCQSGPTDEETREMLVGTWTYDLDMTEYFKEKLEISKEGLADYCQLHDFIIRVNLVFEEDGDFTLSPDEDALRASVTTLREDIKSGCSPYLEALFEQEGIEGDTEILLWAATGLNMEKFSEQMVDKIVGDVDTVVDDLSSSLGRYGTFEIEGDDMVLDCNSGRKGLTFAVEESTLILTDLNINHFENPAVFTRK